jgi:predicted nucleotidyltransferase
MEEVKKLYTALIGKGYTANDLGDEDVFAKKMQDEQNRRELYDYVSSRGDFKIGSYDNYEQRLRPAQVQKPQPVVDAYGMPVQPEVSTIEDAPKVEEKPQENLKSDLFKPQSTETPSLLDMGAQPKDYFAEAGAKAMEDIRQERQAREYQEIMKPLSGFEGGEQKNVLEERKKQIEAQLSQSDAVRNAAARTNMAKALENVDKELQVLNEQQKQWQEQYGSWTPSSARRFREQTMEQTWYDPYAVVPEEYKALATQKWGKEGSEDAYFSAWMNLSPEEREAFVKREHIKSFFNEETANKMQGIRERALEEKGRGIAKSAMSPMGYYNNSAEAAMDRIVQDAGNVGTQTLKALDKAEEIKQAYKNHELDENFFAGAYKGMKDGLTDIDNWTGLYMVGEMTNLYDIADKMEKGEALSQTEEDFLDAQAYKLAVEAALADDLGWGYSSGNVTGASVPFMLQMLASPIGGASGKAIDKGFAAVGRRAIDKFGKGILKKLLTKAPVKKVVKGLVGTVGKGIGQTILFGSDRVAAGTMERHLGNEMVAERANEEFNAGVQGKAGEDLGTAFFKAGVSASMENISEFAGGAFIDDFTKTVGKKISKEFMDAMGGSVGRRMANAAARQNANKVFRAIANNKWGQHAVKLSKSVQNGMEWDGLLNEYLEEVLNNASNVMIGDMSMEDFTSLEKNAETLLGLAWTSGFFTASNAASRIGGYARGNIALKRTDRAARQIFTGDMQEKWDAYTQALSQADGYEEVEQLYKGLVADISKNQDKELARAQMSEAAAYMTNYVKMMGMNAATEEADEEEQKTPAQKDIETAQGEGIAAQGTEGEMDVVEEMDESYSQLAGHLEGANVEEWLLQYGETAAKQLEAIRGSELDEQTKAMAEAYLTSAQRYEGLLLANQEEVDAIVDEAAKEFDANVNQDLGSVIQVLTTQGKIAYVIQGNPNERENIRLRYEDGTTEPVSHAAIEKVLSQADANTMRSDMIEGVRKSAVAEVVHRMQGVVPNATQMQMPVGHNVVVDGQAGVVAGVNADGTMQIQMQGGNVMNAAPQQVMDAQAYNTIMERKARARESARVSATVREEVAAPVAEEAAPVAEEAAAEAIAAEEELTEAQKLLQEYMDESVPLEDRQAIVGNNVAQAKQAAMEAQAEVDAMTESKPKAKDYTSIAEFKQAQEEWKAQMQEKQQVLDLARQQEVMWDEVQRGIAQPVETATDQTSAEAVPATPQVTEEQRKEAGDYNQKHDTKALAEELGISAKRIQRVIDFANQVGVKLNFANVTRTQGGNGAFTNADNMASKREITLSKYQLAKGMAIEWVMGHELTHQIKADGNAANWEAYKQAIINALGQDAFDKRVKEQSKVYREAGAYQDMSANEFVEIMQEEVCADAAGDMLLNPDNMNKVMGVPQSLASRIWNSLKNIATFNLPTKTTQAISAWQMLAEGKEVTGEAADREKHSIVGTTGARALDKAEGTTVRMDNMDVAEEMEAAGKDAETIWMATGWERGADGKWKYEVLEDFAYEEPRAKAERLQEEYQQVQNEKENIYRYLNRFPARGLTEQQKAIKKEQNARLKKLIRQGEQLQDEIIESRSDTTLGELIGTDNNIIKAYPELASMPVSFVENSRFMDAGLKGAFDGEGIWINPTLENTAPTLLHEVQHAIQRIEGFARGGNTGSVKTNADALREDVRPLHEMMLDTPEWAERQRLQNRWFDETDAAEIAKIEQRVNEINESGVLDAIQSKRKQLQEKYGSDATVGKILGSPYAEDAEIWQQLPESFNDKYQAYRNLAGEAEARNVSARLNMSEEERRQTRPGKTEDVAREEQIVLEDEGREEQGLKYSVTPEERMEMEARILDWLSEENLTKAAGMTREQIFEEFGNQLEPIAYLPMASVRYVGDNLTDERIYSGKGYFIDHAMRNHAKEGKQTAVEDIDVSKYLNIQNVLDNPDSIKETFVDGKRTVIFIKKIGRYFAELTQVEENGKIVLHKSYFNQKKEPYAKLADIRSISPSLGGGVSPISHADDAAPAISLQSRNDDELSANKDTQSVSTEQTDKKEISGKSAESNVEVTNEEVMHSISPIEGYTYSEVIDMVQNDVENILSEEGADNVEAVEFWAHGSRMRGNAKEDSDLDVVMFYKGNEKEDSLFNLINEHELAIDGIKVDVNPIRISNEQDIARYKEKSARYDQETRFSLAGLHNISEEKLKKAIKQGGLANPSVAVIDLDTRDHNTYGDITLVLPSYMIDKKQGRNAGTYMGDAWTPTYPRVSMRLDNKGWRKIDEFIASISDDAHMRSNMHYAVEDFMQGGSTPYMQYAFLKTKGIEIPFVYKNNDRYISNEEFKELIGMDALTAFNGSIDAYNKFKELPKEVQDELYIWIINRGDRAKIKAMKESIQKDQRYAKLLDYEVPFSKFNMFANDTFRREQDNGKIDYAKTFSEANNHVATNGLGAEYNAWISNLLEEAGAEEYIFAGFTPSGNAKYLPHTLENVSKVMKKEGKSNAYNNTGYGPTRAGIIKALSTLGQIRKNSDTLRTDINTVDETKEELTDRLYELRNKLADMRKLSDNPFINGDYAESRLQEALSRKNPVRYLNEEYGYNIEEDGDFAKKLESFIDDVRKAPVHYFETKFERPVMLDEFHAAVIPNDTDTEVVKALEKAGLNVETYERGNDAERKEALLRASDEQVRFSLSAEEQGIVDAAKADGTYMKAPNGEPTNLNEKQWAQVRTKAFKEWFGDWENDPENASKVVDENGEPMVVYHGSPEQFTEFDMSKFGKTDQGTYGKAFYFTSIKDRASHYGENVMPVFVNARNLINGRKNEALAFVFGSSSAEEAKERLLDPTDDAMTPEEKEYAQALITEDLVEEAKAYDGVDGSTLRTRFAELAVGNPNQIKSATDNVGTFDAENADIRYSIYGGNKGYVGYSMSKRAANAREEGRFPKTDFKKEYGITDASLDALVEAGLIDNTEWHHTSVRGNRTPFYGWTDPSYADYYTEHKAEIDKAARELAKAEPSMGDFEASEIGMDEYSRKHQEWVEQRDTFTQQMQEEFDAASEAWHEQERVRQEQAHAEWLEKTEYENYVSSLGVPAEYDASNGVHVVTNGNGNPYRWEFYWGDKPAFRKYADAAREELKQYIQDNKGDVPSFEKWKDEQPRFSLPAGIPRRRKNESLMDYANRIADILYAQRNATRDWEMQEPAIALARDKYEDRVSSGWYQTREALQDSMLGLKVFMESVLGEGTYIEDVAGVENAYLGENRLSSVNFAEASEFARLVFKPMLEEVAKLAKNDKQRQMLVDYMMAKHGLERNRVMAEKDAQAEAKENQMMTLDELRAKYRNKDYAGLTALTNKKNIRAAEAEAQAMVDAYESTHDTSALWDKVKKTNTATLTKMRESGLLNQEMYDNIANMYEFYIPLRGFDEKTSDEAYAYLAHKDSAFNAPIRRAKGRKSKADDPFAQMQAMAESAIMQGNRNVLVKQKLLNFVQNHPSDLATVSEMWIEYDAANKEWTQITATIADTDTPADVARKTREFNETMEELHKLFPGRYQKAGSRNRIPYKVIAEKLREHQVIVKRNGVDYVITINGSPRAAQAVNGMTNPDSGTGAVSKLFQYGEKVNRVLSGVYTSYNPDFLWSNFIRDTLYTNTMSYVKESPGWAWRFNKNFLKFNPATMGRLLSKWDNGTLDMNNKTEALFYQFMKNGGETGYANIRNIEQHKSEIKEALKKANGRTSAKLAWDAVKTKLELVSRASENGARFAAFATSMQMGRGVERAIYDAKEVSVNFNKKGSGATFMGATGQTVAGNAAAFTSGLGRSFYVFWNAAIQGTTNFGRQAVRHPVRALTVSSVMFGLGVLMSMIGGDDEDDENAFYNLPENIRRTNIMMRFGDHWLTLPLPVEYRAMYGMGQLAGEVLSGKSRMSDWELGMAIAQQVSQMAPIDVLGAGGGWNAFMPSWAKPITDAYVLEKNWAGQPLYKDWDTYAPEWTKAYDSADQNIVGFTRWLNEATGGNAHRKGWADINPAKIEAVIDGYFGGISALTKNLVKTGEMLLGERDYQPRNIPLLRRIVYQGDERTAYRRANEQYRKYKEDHDELHREIRGYEGDMEMGTKDWTEELDRIYNSPEIEQYYIMDWYGKDISKLSEQFNDTTDEEEKDAIRKEINLLKSEAVREIENLQKKKEESE